MKITFNLTFFVAMDAELTKDESFFWGENVLGIENSGKKLMENKLNFLNLLVRRYSERIPFQNFILLAKAHHSDIGVPLWPEIKEHMMAGHGGLCYTLNIFMNVLLKTLGYDVYLAACKVVKNRHDHVYTVVRNLSYEGSEHMVDLNGFPNFESVPLNFESDSPQYKFSYYFKRLDDKSYNIKALYTEPRAFGLYFQEPEDLSILGCLKSTLINSFHLLFVNSMWYLLMVVNVLLCVGQLCYKRMITVYCRKQLLMALC